MFTDPATNLKTLGLDDNAIVADLGAGTGFYSIAAGHLVPRGKVYALEVIKEMLATIKKKAADAHLTNVEGIWGDIEKIGGTKIRDRIADAVILSNILFQVEHKENLIEETKRILKPGGKVLFIDWLPGGAAGLGVIKKEDAKVMFEKKGFAWVRDIPAGDHHYGMILVKN